MRTTRNILSRLLSGKGSKPEVMKPLDAGVIAPQVEAPQPELLKVWKGMSPLEARAQEVLREVGGKKPVSRGALPAGYKLKKSDKPVSDRDKAKADVAKQNDELAQEISRAVMRHPDPQALYLMQKLHGKLKEQFSEMPDKGIDWMLSGALHTSRGCSDLMQETEVISGAILSVLKKMPHPCGKTHAFHLSVLTSEPVIPDIVRRCHYNWPTTTTASLRYRLSVA